MSTGGIVDDVSTGGVSLGGGVAGGPASDEGGVLESTGGGVESGVVIVIPEPEPVSVGGVELASEPPELGVVEPVSPESEGSVELLESPPVSPPLGGGELVFPEPEPVGAEHVPSTDTNLPSITCTQYGAWVF